MKVLRTFLDNYNSRIISQFLLLYVAITISITSILFIIGGSINNMIMIISLLFTSIAIYLFNKDTDKKIILFNIITSILFLLILISIATIFYDNTWDGNDYHKELIGLMKNGMNPLYNNSLGSIWTRHYPNGVETFAATIYSAINNIESGKVINFILIIVLFNYTYDFCKVKKLNKIYSLLIALTAALNPIMLSQFDSYYVDGVLANTIFLIFLSSFKIALNGPSFKNKEDYLVLISSLIICINTKFTAPVLAFIIISMIGLYIIIKNYKSDKKYLKKLIMLIISTFLFSILVVGSSSYVKNTIKNGNPIYPLIGNEEIDLEEGNNPFFFENKFHIVKWGYATFAKTYTWYDRSPDLKLPFSIYQSEFLSLKFPDIRIGGLGIWFSGIFILSIISILFYLPKLIIRKSKMSLLLVIILISIVLPLFVFPVVWQARYYPNLYLIGFVTLLILKLVGTKISKIIFNLILISILINILFFIPEIKYKYIESSRINKELNKIAELSKTNKITISWKTEYSYPGVIYNLDDKNINYNFSKETIENGKEMYHELLYKEE